MAGALTAPWLAAAGAIAALITDCSIEVERVDEAPTETTPDMSGRLETVERNVMWHMGDG